MKMTRRMICHQVGVSLRLMTSQFRDIVNDKQKLKSIKCIFCDVWVQNFVWNFKGALWNFTQNFEAIHCLQFLRVSWYYWIVTSYGLVRRAPGQWQNAWSQTGFDDCCASSWMASVLSHSSSQLGQDFLPLYHLRSTTMQWSSNLSDCSKHGFNGYMLTLSVLFD